MKKYTTQTVAFFVVILSLVGCSTDIKHYNDSQPSFDIKSYFNGDLIAWGLLQDYNNKVTRRFCVEIDASWQQNLGTLKEKFYFDDGEISYRTWNLTKLPQGRYQGTAEDVVGIAEGQQSGFAFRWNYQLNVPIDGTTYQFDMDDWMYQLDDPTKVVNRTAMKKWGATVADITLFFDKSGEKLTCEGP